MPKLALLLLLTVAILGKELIEVFAKNVQATGTNFRASNDVVILYDGGLIKSDRASYDKNSSLLILEGSVEMIDVNNRVLASDRLSIDTTNKSVKLEKLFLAGEEDLWIEASNADKIKENYRLFSSKISSCDKSNPDWTIEFDEAEYYRDREFVTMQSAKLRFYDTTIFYFPYLILPTLNKRTTGLLYPNFETSDRDGFKYEQPIFYAPYDSWDVEFNPQVRSKRGFGSYITARFVDSNHSSGYARVGYFKNNMEYSESKSINQEHWGAELFYKSTDILPKESLFEQKYSSGFYLNSTYLNDREYLNLQKKSASNLVSSNLIESRLNAFMYDSTNYFGLYAKYNIDTKEKNNHRTIQNIPSLHYHHYMSEVIDSKFTYSLDARVNNFTRVLGSSATQTQIDLPITYYDSFFSDYLDISLSENLYLCRVNFSNLSRDTKNGYYYYYKNNHKLTLSSDLSKRDTTYIHTIHPSLTYIQPSIEKESAVAYNELEQEKKDFFIPNSQEEQLSVALSQYYYNLNLDMNFFHRFAYSSYPNRVKSKGDIYNEMGYNRDNLALYSNLIYAWNEKRVRSLTSSLRYNQNNYDIILTHFYNHDFLLKSNRTSFANSKFIYHYNSKNNYFVDFDYDIKRKFNHQWSFGWQHKQKCWSARVSLGQELVPNVGDSFRNTVLYLELNLNPIGGIQQNIEENFSSQGDN